MEMTVMYKKQNTLNSFFKSATVAIVFCNAVSLCTPVVNPPAIERNEKHIPSFNTQSFGYTSVIGASNIPTFSISTSPSKELKSVGQKERIKIPFRQERVAAVNFKTLSDEVLNYSLEKPSTKIVKERISIPFRQEKDISAIGSEFV